MGLRITQYFKQSTNERLRVVRRRAVLVCAAVCLASASHAQQTLEWQGGAGNGGPTGTGPTIGNVSVTAKLNTDNPNGTAFTATSPNQLVTTLSMSDQQYTTLPTTISPTGTAMMFSGATNTTAPSGTTIVGRTIYESLNGIGTPNDALFSSLPSTLNKGIGVASNGAIGVFVTGYPLKVANQPTNGRYYYGKITVAFSYPLDNPVIHVSGLGGSYQTTVNNVTTTLGFTSELELDASSPSNVVLSKLSGTSVFSVANNKVLNTAANPNASCATNVAGCGSVLVTGNGVTSLTFRIYLRGDGNVATWGASPDTSSSAVVGDVWYFGGVSTLPPADMSGAFSNLPVAAAPGTTYNNLTFTCTNAGPFAAQGATCVPSVPAGSGTISNLVCTPSAGSTATNVAVNGTITCTFSLTTPGSAGGSDTGATALTLNGNTSATNDTNGGTGTTGNNSVSATLPVIDAVDDPPSTVGQAGATLPSVLANDTVGTNGANTSNVALTPGTAPVTASGGISMASDGTITIAPGTTPGTYTYPYTICATPVGTPPVCDTATKTITVEGNKVSGNVFQDLTPDTTVNGTPTNAGGLNAVLVDSTNKVIASVPVAADGSYVFPNVPNGSYTVSLSTTPGTPGSAPPAPSLPTGWVNTGDQIGTTAGQQQTATPGVSGAITVNNADVTQVNFGIERAPIAGGGVQNTQPNPTGSVSVPVNPATFTTGSSDPDGTVTGYRISAFPTGVTTITINGITYGPSATPFPSGGVTVTPAQLATIQVDPVDGSVTVDIPFKTIDNLGVESVNTGHALVPIVAIVIAGNVFDDGNGSKVKDSAENLPLPAGLNAVLTDNAGLVIAVVPVDPISGNYAFKDNITPNTTYKVVLSTASPAPGASVTAATLPPNWVTTGENLAGAVEATPDSVQTVNVGIANVTDVNFGIEQRPTAGGGTQPIQPNPTGVATVNVPPALFTTGSSDPDGTIASYTITALPANVTSITISGTTYGPSATPFPPGGVSVTPAQLSSIAIDPIDGAVTVQIPFTVTDNAGATSALPGQATLSFNTISLTGNVFDDSNGSKVRDASETQAVPPLFAVLTNASNQVIATAVVDPGTGNYTFTSVPPNAVVNVVLSTTAPTPGTTVTAATLPSGWVTTGENFAGAIEATPNSAQSVTIGTTNVSGVNFGIERPPVAGGGTQASQPNPLGSATAPVSAASFTTGTSDPDGSVASYRITAFPSNADAIVISGTTYTSADFPAGGVVVLAAEIANVRVDPVDGAVSVVIPFKAIDNAGVESPNTGSATVPFTFVSISGNVFNDINGSKVKDSAETNPIPNGLNAVLTTPAGVVVAVVPVDPATGNFTFTSGVAENTSYVVLLSTSTPAPGDSVTAATLPGDWSTTGENLGGAIEATPNSAQSVSVGTTAVTGVNFGIQQPPVAGGGTQPTQPNPTGTATVTVPTTLFTTGSADPDGTVASYLITAFPANATSITINGTTYTAANFPATGVSVTPAQLASMQVDPVDGAVTVDIPFRTVDNAGAVSANLGHALLPFDTLVLSGNVFNDVNGTKLKDAGETNAVPAGLKAVLTNSAGVVIAVATVDPISGNYSFTNGVAPNATYNVVLTTATPAIGATVTAATLPPGWATTGENLAGTVEPAAAGANSVQTVSVGTSNVAGINFGIQQPPVAGGGTQAVVTNPGGTATVPVNPTSFTTGSSDPDGVVAQYLITAFPVGATSITVNGTVYIAANFPANGVAVAPSALSSIVVDPVDGAVSVRIPFKTIDNAGAVSANTGEAVVPFNVPDLTAKIGAITPAPANQPITIPVSFANIGAGAGINAVPTLKLAPGLAGVVPSNGGVYDPVTGIVTWPTIANFAPNATENYTVNLPMPSAPVSLAANIAAANEPSTVLANNSAQVELSALQVAVPVANGYLMALMLVLLATVGAGASTRAPRRAASRKL